MVDDHAVVRAGLRSFLEPQYEICGEAGEGQEAIDKSAELNPDLILMDISMPKMNGLEASRWIRKLEIKSKIILFSMHDGEQIAQSAKQAGADSFLTKSAPIETLISEISDLLKQL